MISGRKEKLAFHFLRHEVHFSLKSRNLLEYKRNIKGKAHLVIFPKVDNENGNRQRMQFVQSPETG